MNKNRNKSERGITLIALLVMIIILVVLAAVTIRGIAGSEGLISSTETAAVEYKIASYEEQIEQKVRSIIIANAALGKETTTHDIAKGLREETTWVKKAEVDEERSTDYEGYIYVTVYEGYVFQVYYNAAYGIVKVEYVGKEGEEGSFPKVEARYEKDEASIKAKVSIEKGEIEKVELIYKEEVIDTKTSGLNSELTFDVNKYGTGWYEIRATSKEGKIGYAVVKVSNISELLKVPEIEVEAIEPKIEKTTKWYVSKVKVTITSPENNSKYAKEIHYTLVGAVTQKEKTETGTAGSKTEFEIGITGLTKVVAWIEDGNGNQSKEITQDIYVDIDKPEIKELKLDGTKGTEIETEKSTYTWIISDRRNNNRRSRRCRKPD